MNNTEKLVIAFAIFIIGTGSFAGLGEWFNTIDMETVPSFAANAVSMVQNFFSYGAIAFILLYLRNLGGYAYNLISKSKTEVVNYEMDKYYKTIVYYLGIFTPIVAAIPYPYNWLGGVLVAFTDIFTSEWKKISS